MDQHLVSSLHSSFIMRKTFDCFPRHYNHHSLSIRILKPLGKNSSYLHYNENSLWSYMVQCKGATFDTPTAKGHFSYYLKKQIKSQNARSTTWLKNSKFKGLEFPFV